MSIPRGGRNASLAVALLLILAVGLHLAMLESLVSGRLNGWFDDSTHRKGQAVDFFTVYWGSYRGLQGGSLYRYDLPHGTGPHDPPYAYSNFRYFPGFAFSVGAMLTRFRPWTAYWVWVALTELLCLAGAFWAQRLAGRWGASRTWAWAAVALWLGFSPYYLELYMGQFTLPLAVGILWMLDLAHAGRLAALARAWVVSLLWKFATALYLPVFHRLRAGWALAIAALAVGFFTVPYFALHPGDAGHFLRYFVMGLGAKPHAGNFGAQALLSVVAEAAWPASWAARVHGVALPLWRGVILLLTLTWVALAWRHTLRARAEDAALMVCLWTCMYFSISRDVWEHHTLLLLPVLTFLLARLPGRRAGVFAAGVVLALPTFFRLFDLPGLAPEVDPGPLWPFWERLLEPACKALPALWLTWISYRALEPSLRGRVEDLSGAGAGSPA